MVLYKSQFDHTFFQSSNGLFYQPHSKLWQMVLHLLSRVTAYLSLSILYPVSFSKDPSINSLKLLGLPQKNTRGGEFRLYCEHV